VGLALELGVRPDRIDTIADFAAPAKYGVKLEGSSAAASAGALGELAAMIDKGQLEIPIAGVYALSDVQAAFQELAQGHTRGKIVLKP
jgi:NADPH:quinone reductase-like Zn-dependent oxidoreductase